MDQMPTPTTQVTKKSWLTPELIVLVRRRPEEAVLTACLFAGDCQTQEEAFVNQIS